MPSESLLHSTTHDASPTSCDLQSLQEDAWRQTFAAAQRVIEHHRTNLEARLAITRLQREEPRSVR